MSRPTEIRLHKDRKALTVTFDTGESFALPAEYLRVKSPSAEVQGHSPSERKTVPGKRYVEILEVQPVGNYAVQLTFSTNWRPRGSRASPRPGAEKLRLHVERKSPPGPHRSGPDREPHDVQRARRPPRT